MGQIILVIHNIRSAHNVGSLLRSADGLGIEQVLISGYSPYPKHGLDERLPHIADKVHSQIHKTALGAEETVNWLRIDDLESKLSELKSFGYVLAALEQAEGAILLNEYLPQENLALVLGSEVTGVDQALLKLMDICLEIPMRGKKESFNVAVAGAIAMYQLSQI